jgi:hypothetical protein
MELLADLDIVMARTDYTLSLCLSFISPLPDVSDSYMNVYLRQKNFPYKRLTNSAKVSASCSSVSLKTLNTLLFFNIRDYAQAVFDFTDYASQTSGFKVTKMQLIARDMEIPQKPKDKVNEVIVDSLVNIVEGWATKYTSVNIGFGIVIAILIVVIIACLFVLNLSYRKMKA